MPFLFFDDDVGSFVPTFGAASSDRCGYLDLSSNAVPCTDVCEEPESVLSFFAEIFGCGRPRCTEECGGAGTLNVSLGFSMLPAESAAVILCRGAKIPWPGEHEK